MPPLLRQILSAAAGVAVALVLVWGFSWIMDSGETPAPPAPTPTAGNTVPDPAPKLPAVMPTASALPASSVPKAPAEKPVQPVHSDTPALNEMLVSAEAQLKANPDKAEVLYRQVLQTAPDNQRAREGLILSLTAQKKFTDLVTLYTALAAAEPNNATHLYNLAVTQTRLTRFFDAEATYAKHMTLDQTNRHAWENYANILAVQGKLSGALTAWKTLATLQATDKTPPSSTWMEIARLELMLEDEDGAKTAFAQVLELTTKAEQSAAPVRTAIAELWSQFGHHGIALANLKLAFRNDGKAPEPWRVQGNVYLRMYGETGDKEHLGRAIHDWQTSLRCNRNQPKLKERLNSAKLLFVKPE